MHATQSMAELAYDRIEAMIVTLVLEPGTVFSEQALAKRIEIGRTPMREALLRLASERLVKAMPRRGMMVTEVNIADHLEILATRRALDRLLAMRAARRGDGETAEALRACAGRIREAAEVGDLEAFMAADRTLDDLIATAARNVYAAEAAAPLHAHCRRFWYLYRGSGDLMRSAELHGALVDTVARGDEGAAGDCSDRLLDYLDDFARAALNH